MVTKLIEGFLIGCAIGVLSACASAPSTSGTSVVDAQCEGTLEAYGEAAHNEQNSGTPALAKKSSRRSTR